MLKDSSKDSSSPAAAPTQRPPITDSWVAPATIIGVVASFFASQLVAGLALYFYGLQHGWSEKYITDWLASSVTAQFVYVALAEVLLLAAIFGMMRWLRWSRQTIGLTRPKLWQLAVGVAAVAPYYVLYVLLVVVVTHIFPNLNVDQKQDVGFSNVVGPLALIMTFVSLVVIPPLAEEIAMRGFLYSGLRTWLPKIAAGLAVSLIFGAAHLAEGGAAGPLWIGAIDTFTLSLVLVYLREKTGSLWAGITLHACKNGIAFVLLYVLHTN